MLGMNWTHQGGNEWLAVCPTGKRILVRFEPDIGEDDNPYWRVCYGGSYIGSTRSEGGRSRRAKRTLEETMAFAEAYHAQNLDVTIDRLRRELRVAEKAREKITVDIYEAMVTG